MQKQIDLLLHTAREQQKTIKHILEIQKILREHIIDLEQKVEKLEMKPIFVDKLKG